MSERLPADRAFVGRTQELAAISACAEAASQGSAGVVLIEGEAGSGKTALVRRATAALPPPFGVLRAEADEFLSDEPLATLSQLGPIDVSNAFGAGMALLELLNDAQRTGPVALVVDDLHWADTASRLALLTAARRLGDDRVLVMVTSRPDVAATDAWARFAQDPDRCHKLVLGGLSGSDVAELAQRVGLPLAFDHVERLHQHTKGHPLHVRTLLGELTAEQLTAPDTPLPAPRSLASATNLRLSELPPECRDLAAALAVANRCVPLRTAGRIAGVAQPASALEPLLATGFVTWQPADADAPVEFSHPLYRAAVYDGLSPTRRQALHQAAAEVLDVGAAFEHRVAATDGVDDDLADELDAAARRQWASGGLGVAARYLLWASSVTSARPMQEHRLLNAVRLLLIDGQAARAATLAPRLAACEDGPLRSLVLGELAWHRGDAPAAERSLLTVRATSEDTAVDSEIVATALARLSTLYVTQGRAQDAIATATRALALDRSNRVERLAQISLAFGEGMLQGAPAALASLRRRLPAKASDVVDRDADLLVTRGALLMHAGRVSAGVADLRAAIQRARHGVRVVLLPRAHLYLSQLLFSAGDWDEALVHARVARSLVSDQTETSLHAQVHAALGEILAARGEWEEATEQLSAARRAVDLYHVPEGIWMLRLAEAAVARARQVPGAVVDALLPLAEDGERIPGSKLSSLGWLPALVVATIDAHDIGGAARLLQQLEQTADTQGLDLSGRVEALRARLLLATGDPEGAVITFGQAIELLGADDPLLDRALVHHDLGRLLRARGNRRSAIDHLRTAHGLLAGVGAAPYQRRVETDLENCGIRRDASRARSPLSLTDRERDVVVLVSKGMTNREVAAQLYVSAKSVEYHLRNVYGKLGIRSRRELRGLAPI